MAFTPEMQAKIQLWRQKAREGTMTVEEYREVIAALRQDRVAAAGASASSKERKATAKAKKDIDSDGLLNELDGL